MDAPQPVETGNELARLRAENEELKKRNMHGLTGRMALRVSPKGGVTLYGLQRFPTTLYAWQWLLLLDAADAIRAFIRENADKLAPDKLKAKPKEDEP